MFVRFHCTFKKLSGLCPIPSHALAGIVEEPKIEKGIRVILFGGLFKPANGLRQVRGDTFSVAVT